MLCDFCVPYPETPNLDVCKNVQAGKVVKF